MGQNVFYDGKEILIQDSPFASHEQKLSRYVEAEGNLALDGGYHVHPDRLLLALVLVKCQLNAQALQAARAFVVAVRTRPSESGTLMQNAETLTIHETQQG